MFFIRIDDRYIHGQVGVVWASHLKVKTVLIANDELVKDSFACTMQKLSAPNLKVLIKSVEDASAFLKTLSQQALSTILVLVNCPADICRIMDNGFKVKHVNIGHSKPAPDKKELAKYLNVGKEDLEAYQALQRKGVVIEFQLIPNHKPLVVDYMSLRLD